MFALVSLLQDNKPENWDSERAQGRKERGGESDSDTLSTCESTTTGLLWSRLSCLTAVGEGVCGVGWWGSLPTGRGGGGEWEEEEEGESRMCLLMRLSALSQEVYRLQVGPLCVFSNFWWMRIRAVHARTCTPPPPPHPPHSYTQVMTVILSDRLKSSLLCHVVILVDPLLSYCTTAVVKTWCSCIFVCVSVSEREREQRRLLVLPGLIDN